MANGTFATAPATLANMNHLTPRPVKGLFGDNYLSLAEMDFTQQFLPEVYEKEVERFGNRTIGGFLRMVGAEMPMASDRVVWSEQGRLHIAYGPDNGIVTGAANGATITIAQTLALPSLIGPGMTLVMNVGNTTVKAFVVSVAKTSDTVQTVTISVYNGSATGGTGNGIFLPTAFRSSAAIQLFVYGSEYGKGSARGGNSVDAPFTQFNNKPIILRDEYEVNGSDVAQIGWVEVTTEMGTGGYMWYLKSEHESRLRFDDYLEMSMVEAEKANTAADGTALVVDAAGAVLEGTEGLFAALEDRGLVFNNSDFGVNGISDFDIILQELDKQGAIEENMMFLDRATSLGIDNMLDRKSVV